MHITPEVAHRAYTDPTYPSIISGIAYNELLPIGHARTPAPPNIRRMLIEGDTDAWNHSSAFLSADEIRPHHLIECDVLMRHKTDTQCGRVSSCHFDGSSIYVNVQLSKNAHANAVRQRERTRIIKLYEIQQKNGRHAVVEAQHNDATLRPYGWSMNFNLTVGDDGFTHFNGMCEISLTEDPFYEGSIVTIVADKFGGKGRMY